MPQDPLFSAAFECRRPDTPTVSACHPHRIEALLLCHFLAMLTEALLEREIRTAIKTAGLTGIPLYPNSATAPPPARPASWKFSTTSNATTSSTSTTRSSRPSNPNSPPLQQQVLELRHLPTSVYNTTETL